jgi:hypothetical protein
MFPSLLLTLALAGPSAPPPQSVIVSERTVTTTEWTRLKQTVDALLREDTTRKLYRASTGLQETYPAEPFFMSYAAKWRPRLEALPATRAQAPKVSLLLKEMPDGEEWIMTLHHATPKFAITVIKTGWRDGKLRSLSFTRGFTEVNYGRR